MRLLRPWLLSLSLLVLVGIEAHALAVTQSVTVNMDDHTVTPELATVNMMTGDSLVIDINPKANRDTDEYFSTVMIDGNMVKGTAGTCYGNLPRQAGWTCGSRIIINFQQNANAAFSRWESENSWTVVGNHAVVGVTIWSSTRLPFLVPIQLEQKPWMIEWSAGFGFFADLAARSYAVDSSGAVTEVGRCAGSRPTQCGLDYRLAAFVHYIPVGYEKFSASFGLSTNLPSTGFTAMLGPSIRLRALPIVNDSFLTIGPAFGPLTRIKPAVEHSGTVPMGSDVSAVTETRYGFSLFASITFGFLGGEDQFKAVYSGKKE
jgi:hypothetical protein